MQDDMRVRSTAQIAGHPIHPMLVPIPIACFIGAMLTDIAYVASTEIMWGKFSAWLLVVGVIFGVLAAIAGLTDFLGNGHRQDRRAAGCRRRRQHGPAGERGATAADATLSSSPR